MPFKSYSFDTEGTQGSGYHPLVYRQLTFPSRTFPPTCSMLHISPEQFPGMYERDRWSSGIEAAIGARGRGSRPVHYLTVQRPWTSRLPLIVCSSDKRLSGCWRLIRLL